MIEVFLQGRRNASIMTDLAGYTIKTVWDDGEFILSQVRRADWNSAFLLVTPSLVQPAPTTIARLEQAYRLRNQLSGGWAAVPIEIVAHRGHPALLLQDPGGEPLARLIGTPWDVAQFLRVGIGIAASLGRLHAAGFVHKDIKPSNVLVNVETGEAWLTGFGIASRVARERQAPEVVAGTFAYMAPEQTGRMNRSIDSRSDLYAYGVTLFEMLTGALPFEAADSIEWIHCHVARRPASPGDRAAGIPDAISAIVLKLLAKNAEDRYQTAAGVESDLRRCLAEWEASGRIGIFELGANDIPERLVIPEKLYGRQREIDTMLEAFHRVAASGRVEIVLVAGYSGIGKSSVVNELHKALVGPRGIFAAGKCERHKRDIPYATLAQAFQVLVRPILGSSDAEFRYWRTAMEQAVGPNGPLLVNLIPEVELIIGKQPPTPELPAHEAQHRVQTVCQRFIGLFARPDHPLVLFLDDLQWLDVATLELLQYLVTAPGVGNLLLIGAYRENEVTGAHPLARALEGIRRTEVRLHQIVMGPLAPDDVQRLAADALRCEPERVRPLAELVYRKTGGNPFFVIQFLTELAEEGLIAFDPKAAEFRWDIDGIGARRYTDNVVDLMVGKLNRLPAGAREGLKLLACLGSVAEISVLSLVHGKSEEAIQAALREAVSSGLVFELDGAYLFLHDRVQEAAYSLIPEAERAGMHLQVGRRLKANTPSGKIEEAVFAIVNQLNRGATLIAGREEREQVAELNLLAGKRAKAATAYDSALSYLTAGTALLDEEPWERCYRLAFELHLLRAECEFLTGDTAAAEERLELLARHAANLVDLAGATCLRISLYTALDRSDRAVEVGLEYLRRIGIQLPVHPTDEDLHQEYERMWRLIGGRRIEDLFDLPLMAAPEWRGTMDVLQALTAPAAFTSENLVGVVLLHMTSLSLEHGHTDASCHSYVCLDMIVGTRFGDYQAGHQFGQLSVDLIEKRGLDRFKARVYLCFGNGVLPWTRHLRTGRDLVRRALDAALEGGDLTFAGYTWENIIKNLLASGDPLGEVQRVAEQAVEFVRKAKFGLVLATVAGQLMYVRGLRGLTVDFSSVDDRWRGQSGFEEYLEANPQLALAAAWHWIRKLQARFFAGDYSGALDAIAKVQRHLWVTVCYFDYVEYHFYSALVHASVYASAELEEQPRHFGAVLEHHRQLGVWAENCAENFAHRVSLVAAEIARIEGRELAAERLYEQSIRQAREQGFIQNEGIANELAARFYAGRGLETISHAYLRNARYCFLRWGADSKVRQLDELHPHLRDDSPARRDTATTIEHLDFAAFVKASQAVSSEIVLDRLIRTLMTIAVEHAGAERALLLLPDGSEPRIEAEATARSDGIAVWFLRRAPSASDLPDTILKYVLRTQDSVILDDARSENLFSSDEYLVQKRVRSMLCLPLVKQAKVVGVLYLENNLASQVFTSGCIEVLKLLASQAAIALENAHLYAEVRRSEHRLRLAIDTIPGMVWSNFPDGSMDSINQRWQEYTGLPAADAFDERWHDAIHPEDVAGMASAWTTALATGKPYVHESRIRRADGQYRWFLSRALPLLDESGKVVKWYGTNTDIEDRKRAEAALRESERNLGLIIETIPALVWCAAPTGELLYVNERVLSYTGTTMSELTEVGWTHLLHPDDLEPTIRAWSHSIQTGDPHEVEYRYRGADGTYRWFQVLGQPLRDSEGSIVRWYGLLIDIDDRKKAEAALRNTQERLSRAAQIATVGELTASIAHEISQPLAAVVTNGQACLHWLSGEPPNLPKVRTGVERIVRDGKDAGEVVRHIRALFKRTPPDKAPLNINELIDEVLRVVEAETLRRHVTVETDLQRDLPRITGDRVQLQQVVSNLLLNGMEAMEGVTNGNRKLVVRSRCEAPNSVLVEIRDYGSGVEDAERIFETFYTTKVNGLGMGLPICRSIIEAHQGRLWPVRNLDSGTTFCFTLPVDPEH